jgi:hypothetical protein
MNLNVPDNAAKTGFEDTTVTGMSMSPGIVFKSYIIGSSRRAQPIVTSRDRKIH